jgi:hypothetical protein
MVLVLSLHVRRVTAARVLSGRSGSGSGRSRLFSSGGRGGGSGAAAGPGTSKRSAFFAQQQALAEAAAGGVPAAAVARPTANSPSFGGRSIPLSGAARSDGWSEQVRPGGLPSAEFLRKAEACVGALHAGVEALHAQNPTADVVFVPGKALTIELREQRAKFAFSVLEDTQTIEFFSPNSGSRSYAWNPERRRWLSVVDGHDMEGLVTRDMMRFIYGVPDFGLDRATP